MSNEVQVYKGRDVMDGNGVRAAIMRAPAPLFKSVDKSLLKRGVLGASKVATNFVLGKKFEDCHEEIRKGGGRFSR